jgi:CRP/FNR family nitrogen fixation transcriptional regulator
MQARSVAADVLADLLTSGAAGSISIIDSMGAPMTFRRNAEIYGENEPADYLYKLASGAVRTSKLRSDGRRQIGAFYLPGDVFGLENGEMHRFSAEAITDSKVLVIKRSAITALAARDNHVARELWSVTSRELERVQEHLTVLVKSAEERVVGFLLELAKRAPGATQVQLPMSRQDIADYLGLTIETVSRTLTRLEGLSAIALPSARCVVLRDQATLGRLNS